jgi:hypothetical protein
MNDEIIFIVEARTTSCAAMTSGILDQDFRDTQSLHRSALSRFFPFPRVSLQLFKAQP